MTAIARYTSKKAFIEAIKADPSKVTIEDPSIVAPFYGRLDHYLERNNPAYFTNHPKRSWYCQVKMNVKTGKITAS